jgi:hypothetical protein
MKETLSIRVDAKNPSHHLWDNGGTWWIHYTVHTEDGRVRRVRYSLGTADLEQARILRDAVFAAWTDGAERRPGPGRPSFELADNYDGLPDGGRAPDTVQTRRLARIDRGSNMLGTLVDDYYVVQDSGWGDATHAVLWVSIDGTQTEDCVGRIVPLARAPLEDFVDPEVGELDLPTAGAHLLHAWLRYALACSWHTERELSNVAGGDLLEDEVVERIVALALRGAPLDLDGEGRP